MNDISVVMLTIDRSPKKNYFVDTIQNLQRGGVFRSARLKTPFWVVDSGGMSLWPPREVLPSIVMVDRATTRRCANENAATALALGAKNGAPWVLFIEDDIDVCANFLESVGAWLDRYAQPTVNVYSFGANYDAVRRKRVGAWDYPIKDFYGTQCFAIRSEDAASLSTFLLENLYTLNWEGRAYDLLMHKWSRFHWPNREFFMASVPSFVDHLGDVSTLGSRHFTFPSWRGRGWSYAS